MHAFIVNLEIPYFAFYGLNGSKVNRYQKIK